MAWGPLAILVLAAGALYLSGVWRWLSVDALARHREALQAWVDTHALIAPLGFIALYAILVMLSVPGATVMTLAGGFLFGMWTGGLATLVAATSGATVIFLVARSTLGGLIVARARRRSGRFEQLAASFRRDAFFYILSLRLTPVAPFWMVNLAAGAGRAPLAAFVAASVIGMAPATFVYSMIGAGLDRAFAVGERPSIPSLLRADLVFPLLGLAVLALVPVILRRVLAAARAPRDA